MNNTEQLKYPIGSFQIPNTITSAHIIEWIAIIESFPDKVASELKEIPNTELQFKYRPNGWSIQQVVNHCIDSHMNSIIRFKLALTENNPIIRPYREEFWAELSDTLQYDINESILLLMSIHKRWVFLLKSLSTEQLNKTFVHPDGNETISLKANLCIYAWHCQHHLQHIINAKKMKFLK